MHEFDHLGKGVKWEDKRNDTDSGKHQYLLSKCKQKNGWRYTKLTGGIWGPGGQEWRISGKESDYHYQIQ